MGKQRTINLDLLRIIAIIAVVMIHTSASFLIQYDITSSEHLWGNILDSISRFAVPVFIMISGALMLNENKSINTSSIYTKNIKSLVFLLIFWSPIYVIIYDIVGGLLFGKVVSIKYIITHLLTGHFHMWYIYMTIGLYILTPFLRCFVKYENRKLVLCFIALGLITQFINPVLIELTSSFPIIENISIIINQLSLDFFGGYTVYYLTGWYIVHVGINKKIRKKLMLVSIISLFITIVYVQLSNNYDTAYSNLNVIIYLYSIGIFSTIFNLKLNKLTAIRIQNKIVLLSKLTFGVYILHLLVLEIVEKLFIYQQFPLLYMLVISFITTIISFIISYLMSKYNFTKKLIHF